MAKLKEINPKYLVEYNTLQNEFPESLICPHHSKFGVCKIFLEISNVVKFSGTGFLLNIPGSPAKFGIMTCHHVLSPICSSDTDTPNLAKVFFLFDFMQPQQYYQLSQHVDTSTVKNI